MVINGRKIMWTNSLLCAEIFSPLHTNRVRAPENYSRVERSAVHGFLEYLVRIQIVSVGRSICRSICSSVGSSAGSSVAGSAVGSIGGLVGGLVAGSTGSSVGSAVEFIVDESYGSSRSGVQ